MAKVYGFRNILGKRRLSGQEFTRKSTHPRKIPHPNAKEARKLSSKGILTATQAQEKLQKRGYKTRIIKEKYWYDDYSYDPYWSVFVRK